MDSELIIRQEAFRAGAPASLRHRFAAAGSVMRQSRLADLDVLQVRTVSSLNAIRPVPRDRREASREANRQTRR